MSLPAIVVRFELGAPPVVHVEADHDDAGRLTNWLDENPTLARLLAKAVELAEEADA